MTTTQISTSPLVSGPQLITGLPSTSNVSLDIFPQYIAALYIDYIYIPICATLGIVGNVLAFCVLISSKTKSTTYVYMSSLCVSDTMVQIANILFFVHKFPGHETLKVSMSLYDVLVMVTMTIERYLAICFPLSAGRWLTLSRARLLVVLEAVLVAGLDVQHMFLRGMRYNEVANQYYCQPMPGPTEFYAHKIWPWIDSVIYCYGPLACLIIFNILILRQVKSSRAFQSKMAGTEAADKAQGSSSKMSDAELQVTRMLLLVTSTFLVCVGPMAFIIVAERYFWFPSTPQEFATRYFVRTIFNNLDYTNHALNFFLYCVSGRRFRQELVDTFSFLCPAKVKATTSAKGVTSGRDRPPLEASSSTAITVT
ncbi:hypothetical protein BaRGS_00006890 [Batillaria attramentaria]|uniref:G-protein coupled receptors family 1 profile domain-containing protein n=1 Tax=Batillaria attramentaria TaxID=370345 RepID=A0ABD0LS08_9CAEN